MRSGAVDEALSGETEEGDKRQGPASMVAAPFRVTVRFGDGANGID